MSFGGFSNSTLIFHGPDSKWIAYPLRWRTFFTRCIVIQLKPQVTQVTSEMADVRMPAFDRGSKYLYFIASTKRGATSDGWT